MTNSENGTFPGWGKLALAALSGSACYVISPPQPFYLLQWLSWVPLFLVLQGKNPKQDFLLGWLSGVFFNITGFYWIVHTIVAFSNLPLPVAIPVLLIFAAYGGLPFGLLGLAMPRIRAAFGAWSILITPAVWVAIELTFPLIFPFHQGDLQSRLLPIMQLASITGVFGISYLLLAFNLVLFELWQAARGRAEWPTIPASMVLVALILIFVWGKLRVNRLDAESEKAPKLRLGLIQANYGVVERRASTRTKVFERYERLSKEAIRKGATVVIWGEGASPYAPYRGWNKLERFVKQNKIDLITGGSGREVREGELHYFNSAYALPHDSPEEYQQYNKQVLLAFGEYMPFSETFPWLKGKIEGIGDFTAGEGPGLFEFTQSTGQIRALMLICYEAILDNFVQEQAKGKPNLFINITHDAWFGDTSCPHQFLILVASRAVEQGTSVARVANTGISAVIDPTGRVRGQTPLFKQAVAVEDVTTLVFPTVYQRIGNLFAYLCCLLTLVVSGVFWRKREQFAKPAPQ